MYIIMCKCLSVTGIKGSTLLQLQFCKLVSLAGSTIKCKYYLYTVAVVFPLLLHTQNKLAGTVHVAGIDTVHVLLLGTQ